MRHYRLGLWSGIYLVISSTVSLVGAARDFVHGPPSPALPLLALRLAMAAIAVAYLATWIARMPQPEKSQLISGCRD